MNASTEASVPAEMPAVRPSPSKPIQTNATLEQLRAHYNAQLPDYVAVLLATTGEDPKLSALADDDGSTKEQVIELIRRQNYRLKRFIRHRSIALLQEVVEADPDGRTVGRSYADILDLLAIEFPEASTSAACLRWYVVHLWSEADEEGLPRPKMPQVRPRSVKRKG